MDCITALKYYQCFQPDRKKQASIGESEEDSNEVKQKRKVIKSICPTNESDSFCYDCYKKTIKKKLVELERSNAQKNELKKKLEQKLQQKEILLRIKQKEEYLKLLKRQHDLMKCQIEKHKDMDEDFAMVASKKIFERDQLEREFTGLQISTCEKDSELLTLRSRLRLLEAKKILKAYDLYNINSIYTDFSISQDLVCNIIKDIVVVDNDGANQSSEKNISKISYKDQHFNKYSEDHKLIINYSLQNLIKFIDYVIQVKNICIPFCFGRDAQNQPELQSFLDLEYPQMSTEYQFPNEMVYIQLFKDESPIPLYDNFIYCWINYYILYRRLGINFKENVIDKKLIFPVYQLKQFFENEIRQTTDQLLTSKHNEIAYNDQLIKSDLLQIKYHKRALKIISEEITICRNDPNLQIIQISQIQDHQKESKLIESSSDLDSSFEFIDQHRSSIEETVSIFQ